MTQAQNLKDKVKRRNEKDEGGVRRRQKEKNENYRVGRETRRK